MGMETIDLYVARRQLRPAGHVSRMDHEVRLPRRMLSSWVPQRRPVGGPTMTYGRSIFKAMDKFNLDVERWHELAAQRGPWRAMLKTGIAPAGCIPIPTATASTARPPRRRSLSRGPSPCVLARARPLRASTNRCERSGSLSRRTMDDHLPTTSLLYLPTIHSLGGMGGTPPVLGLAWGCLESGVIRYCDDTNISAL